MLDEGGVKKGETVWVGEAGRLRKCQVSESDPGWVASEWGQGLRGSRAGAGGCGGPSVRQRLRERGPWECRACMYHSGDVYGSVELSDNGKV